MNDSLTPVPEARSAPAGRVQERDTSRAGDIGENGIVPTITSRVLESADEQTAAALAALLPQVSSRAAPLTLDRVKAWWRSAPRRLSWHALTVVSSA